MEKSRYVVYCHRNKITGFEYIGMTGRSTKIRWANPNYSYASCTAFEKAIKEYGWDAFEHIVLLDNLTKEEAENEESRLIRQNIAKGISYNIRVDNNWIGDIRKKEVDIFTVDGEYLETCSSIHEAAKRYGISDTHAYYCVCGVKKTVCRKYIFVPHGSSISKRVQLAKIDRRFGPAHNRRAVRMLSKDGQIVRDFDSATEASKYINIGVANIVWCCKGKKKTCGGYKFVYA